MFDPTGEGWPKVRLPQVAFAGRSNVGKSSVLNALAGGGKLAHVSRSPGRTRGIVFFEVDGKFAFADLPGYGYAKVSRAERDVWKSLVEGYFSACRRLKKVYLLVDVRRGPEEEERMLAEYLAGLDLPYRWVGTKIDKLSANERRILPVRFTGADWLVKGGPPVFVSARSREGIDLMWRDIRSAFST